ncbi:MAG TPA: L-rhamnose/proton symporter RhaT [Bryobacteraceae bacterium]|nr:L-rhamnose/proton symporter RhaT [Bryobacteraceae bacterium]
MILAGIFFATLSGVCNGLFTTPMKLESRWKWENLWLGFILVSCIAMPIAIVGWTTPAWRHLLVSAPRNALAAALGFGFAWGFGAIAFGRSVDCLGVSISNSLVIGLSSALGSLVPLILGGTFHFSTKVMTLFAGILAFLLGVTLCGAAGLLRDREALGPTARPQTQGYIFAIAAGVMSAIFNIGFTLALPIANTGLRAGQSQFGATNCIWLLMLGAGAIPNVAYCLFLMRKNGTAELMISHPGVRGWPLSASMGLLWGGSIFLYGAAVPRLGDIGPSIGWPLSLAVGLLVANLMGLLLGEWKSAPIPAIVRMWIGLLALLIAAALCAASTKMT